MRALVRRPQGIRREKRGASRSITSQTAAAGELERLCVAAPLSAHDDVAHLEDDLLHTFADDVVIVSIEHLDQIWAVRPGMPTGTTVPRPATP